MWPFTSAYDVAMNLLKFHYICGTEIKGEIKENRPFW